MPLLAFPARIQMDRGLPDVFRRFPGRSPAGPDGSPAGSGSSIGNPARSALFFIRIPSQLIPVASSSGKPGRTDQTQCHSLQFSEVIGPYNLHTNLRSRQWRSGIEPARIRHRIHTDRFSRRCFRSLITRKLPHIIDLKAAILRLSTPDKSQYVGIAGDPASSGISGIASKGL